MGNPVFQSFLDSLVGLPTNGARAKALLADYEARVFESGSFVCSAAVGDTIDLFEENGVVKEAYAGDPCDLVDDVNP